MRFRGIFFCLALTFIVFSFSCKSTPDVKNSDNTVDMVGRVDLPLEQKQNSSAESEKHPVSEDETIPFEEESVKLEIPTKSNPKIEKKPFSTIKIETLKLVEKGTVESLKKAAAELRSPEQDYSESEVILLNVISGIMDIVYPKEKISWPVPIAGNDNNYIAILESAKKGAYYFSASEKDFFSLALPSLVLFTAPSLKNFYSEAEISLKSALNLNPDSFLGNYLLGLLYFRQERDKDALVYFNKAYDIDSTSTGFNQIYTTCLMRSGNNEKANAVASKILEQNPNNTDSLKVLAVAGYNSGNLEAAEENVIKVLQQEPDNMDFILLRAKILMKKGEFMNVASLLDLYGRKNSTSKDYLLLKAELLMKWNKNISAASAAMQTALELYPEDIDVLLFSASIMSVSKQKIGNHSLKEVIDKVLEKDPDNLVAQELMISEKISEEKWEDAYVISSSFIKRGIYSSDLLLMHFQCCIETGKNSEARRTFDILSTTDVKKSDLELTHVQLLIAESKFGEANSIIKKAVSSYTGKEKSDFLYEKSRIAQNPEQKLSDLRSSLTANPRNPKSLFALYQHYFEKKDYRKAQYYLRQVVALDPRNSRYTQLNAQLDSLIQ